LHDDGVVSEGDFRVDAKVVSHKARAYAAFKA
jgi:hypothetical protein